MKKTYDTIILGAGISGIGCANQLLKNDYKDFKIISPDIGGRILESGGDTVEYGAYYMMNIYHHIKGYMDIKGKIKISDLIFHKNGKRYKFIFKNIIPLSFQLIKLVFILLKFKRHYEKFKKCCEYESQINCFKKDEYLWNLYNTKTEDFIKEHKLYNIFYDYMAEVLHGSGFVPIKKLNAFTLLHFSLPLILPVYEFNFRQNQVEDLLRENLVNDIVVEVYREENFYKISTQENDVFYCKNLISALPPHLAKKLLQFKEELREPVNVFMFHLQGKIKEEWNEANYNLFDDDNPILALALQKDGSYLFYSRNQDINLNNYFEDYSVIEKKFWNPAFNIGGSNFVNFEQGENLYVIGDNNICGLEDSYIYGIYAGNKILGKTKD